MERIFPRRFTTTRLYNLLQSTGIIQTRIKNLREFSDNREIETAALVLSNSLHQASLSPPSSPIRRVKDKNGNSHLEIDFTVATSQPINSNEDGDRTLLDIREEIQEPEDIYLHPFRSGLEEHILGKLIFTVILN
jgi:hypothetical protein